MGACARRRHASPVAIARLYFAPAQSHEAVLSLEVHLSTRVYNVEAGLQAYFEDEVLDEGNEYRRAGLAGEGGCGGQGQLFNATGIG